VIPLRNCRKVIGENGRVLLIEWVMPAGDEAREGFWFWDTVAMDLSMLGIFGSGSGRARTESGFRDLLAAAEFELTTVTPTRSSVSVPEAKPV
jgi:orsellinic acid C3-O-methyltransferase